MNSLTAFGLSSTHIYARTWGPKISYWFISFLVFGKLYRQRIDTLPSAQFLGKGAKAGRFACSFMDSSGGVAE